MIMHYIAYREDGIFSRRTGIILRVWCDGILHQEERPRIMTTQKQGKHHGQMNPFANGLLLGAIAAGGIVTGLLELKMKRDEKQARNIFSWAALSGTERRYQ